MITPIEIAFPMTTVKDHGLDLVHEMGGRPRNYLHSVSIQDADQPARDYAFDAGYSADYGWLDSAHKHWWTFRKAYPLSVAAWAEVTK